MGSKKLLTLSVLVLSFILLSACGYIKDMKEKAKTQESPVNTRTEEPASPAEGKVYPADETSKEDLNNGHSQSKGDNSNTVSNEKSKESSNSDLNQDQSTNK